MNDLKRFGILLFLLFLTKIITAQTFFEQEDINKTCQEMKGWSPTSYKKDVTYYSNCILVHLLKEKGCGEIPIDTIISYIQNSCLDFRLDVQKQKGVKEYLITDSLVDFALKLNSNDSILAVFQYARQFHDFNLRMKVFKANIFSQLNNKKVDALLLYSDVIKELPAIIGLRISKAKVLADMGKFNLALFELKEAEGFLSFEDSMYAELKVLKTSFLWELGSIDLALKEISLAINHSPKMTKALNSRAYLFICKNEYDSALLDLNRALTENETDSFGLLNSGFCNLELGKLAISDSFYSILLNLYPNHPLVLSNYGYLHHLLGKSEKGEKMIFKSLSIDPSNSYAYKYLANIKIDQKEMKEACEYIKKGLSLGFTPMYGDELEGLIIKYCK